MQHILVVEDDEVMREMLVYNLERAGYQVGIASNGPLALEMVQKQPPDLVILDILLPGMDGLEVCRRLRQQTIGATTPVLLLTAMAEEVDIVVGLEMGADDYLTKPFSLREFLARVRALLRRVLLSTPVLETVVSSEQAPTEEKAGSSLAAKRLLEAGPLRVDLLGRRVFLNEQEIFLQPKQFDLLVYFLRNRGVVLTRDSLLTHVWGYDYVGDGRTVDVHVRWLREKIEGDPAKPVLIQTIRGVGYCFR